MNLKKESSLIFRIEREYVTREIMEAHTITMKLHCNLPLVRFVLMIPPFTIIYYILLFIFFG